MDWQALRDQLVTAAKEFTDYGGTLDGLSQSLIDFIPAEPNKAADAEWLKGRGWNTDCELPFLAENESLGLVFEDTEDGNRLRFYGTMTCFKRPSRMIVALFEAAAMEAMKHGE